MATHYSDYVAAITLNVFVLHFILEFVLVFPLCILQHGCMAEPD